MDLKTTFGTITVPSSPTPSEAAEARDGSEQRGTLASAAPQNIEAGENLATLDFRSLMLDTLGGRTQRAARWNWSRRQLDDF